MTSQRAALGGLLDDLPLFALTQHFCTAVAIVLAKAATLWHTYPDDPFFAAFRRLPSVVAYDLLMLAVVALPIAAAAHLPPPAHRIPRSLVALILYMFFFIWIGLSLTNAAFLITVGSPLNGDWLSLAPRLGSYLFDTATMDTIRLAVGGLVLCLAPLTLTPILLRAARTHTRALSRYFGLGLLVAGLLCLRQEPTTIEAITIRRMTVLAVLFSGTEDMNMGAPAPTRGQAEIVAGLQGGTNEEGRRAFSTLSRKSYNVVLVMWESVGERYLKSHALGDAATPNLDQLSRKGSVRFRQAYSQSPLSVQSVWTLFTGRNPPAKATIFLDPRALPPHGPTLPQVLKSRGYRTAVLIGSYTRSWGANRIVDLGGVDLFEDILTLENRNRFKQIGWSIDGRAINDRFLTWLDDLPRGEPFFSVLWNVDTHYPYRWARMSADDEAQDEGERYKRVIEHADRLLGEIAGGLEKRGLDKDTLIIVAGDHGEGLARPPHPTQRIHGTAVFEDSVHVPLVFLQPDLGQAHMVDAPAVLADIYPTVLDLLGMPRPEGLEGVSLARAISPRSIIIRGMQWWPAAIRTGPNKLILAGPRDAGSLYQLQDDPIEGVDLSARQPEISLALRTHLLFETAQRARTDSSIDIQWRQPWIPDSMQGPRNPRAPRNSP